MKRADSARTGATKARSRARKGTVLECFRDPVRRWFQAAFDAPTRVQEMGWPAIHAGASALLIAPTGSGKTLAAFLAAIDRLMFDAVPARDRRCRVLYVSPLRALAVDIEKNLRAPLEGVARVAEDAGVPCLRPIVAMRTGDTPSKERAAFLRGPSDVLITTPESLYLVLTGAARERLRSVRTVILDEVHALAGTKRGAHLSLSLERLECLTGEPIQRIGLSATVRPVADVARFLGGVQDADLSGSPEGADAGGASSRRTAREVVVLDAGPGRVLDLKVLTPVETLSRVELVDNEPDGRAAAGSRAPGIWPAIHPLILDLIRSHRSTLIFVNSRRLAERMAAALNTLAGAQVVQAHHGSVAREQRLLIEEELKSGRMPGIVATSSLELGIDMGAIDLVIQVEAPPSATSGIQRIGRAGHQVGSPSKGVILPKYRGDLLACAALTDLMVSGAVEPIHVLRNPLDVLAQQIVAMVSMDDWTVDELYHVVQRAAPFADLSRPMLEHVLDMLSGRYPSADFTELRPRITWDRKAGVLHSREGGKQVAVANGGTIPDRGLYGVFLTGAQRGKGRVGELDEEMVFESRVGDILVLGASSWRVEDILRDRVIVAPAPGRPGRTPFWHGDSAGRPLEFGRAIGRLARELLALPARRAADLLTAKHCLDAGAARDLLAYLRSQEESGLVPDDRTIIVERCRDDMGDWRICVLSPFGAKVLAPLAMAMASLVYERLGREIDILWTDDGIVARFPDTIDPPDVDELIPAAAEVEDLVIRQLGVGGGGARRATQGAPVDALFASRFREAAQRALLLPRRHPGRRAPLWQQRKRAADLLNIVSRFPSFPIVLETFRECLHDVFDMGALVKLLREIETGASRVVTVTTPVPSPFASALLFSYVANFIYEGDAPLAERRAQALSIDPMRLRELLGEDELRDLLDADVAVSVEGRLQHLTPDAAPKSADTLHDLLLRLGDLSFDELLARTRAPVEAPQIQPSAEQLCAWLAGLVEQDRVVQVTIGGITRFIAAEDARRYRDALGCRIPAGIPHALMDAVEDPMADLVARFARTHGPFHEDDVAERLGTGVAPVRAALARLEADRRVTRGAFRPGGTTPEWCDGRVLRDLREKSLARLRREVEPVDQVALGRFYPAWHGIAGSSAAGAPSLMEVIERLQGAAIPASTLESQILRARIPDYDPRDLDTLTISGQVRWIGTDEMGPRDGRVKLYPAESLPLPADDTARSSALEDRAAGAAGDLGRRIVAHLHSRGASFFPEIVAAVGPAFPPDLLRALWRLVWSGMISNDTIQPLRGLINPPAERATLPGRRYGAALTGGPYAHRREGRSALYARLTSPQAAGRWSLVSDPHATNVPATDRLQAASACLLRRFGVLTREAAQASEIPGGFEALYPVLRALEESGRIRRGYFVAGLGATQFALPEAVERLRSARDPAGSVGNLLLSSVDPANPYGAALPWPERAEGRKPGRAAGSLVMLMDGALACWISKDGRSLLTFPECVPEQPAPAVIDATARRLAQEAARAPSLLWTDGRVAGASLRSRFAHRGLLIQEIDGEPAQSAAVATAFVRAGFRSTARGLLFRS